MIQVRNIRELRLAYELLALLAPQLQDSGIKDSPQISELKRNIRSFNHMPSSASKIVKEYGMDGYVELVRLPDYLDNHSEDTVCEWFEYNCVQRATPSMYDCTGQSFTNWFKLVRRRGHWFAYHSVGFDV